MYLNNERIMNECYYIYSVDDDIGFDPEDLRKEGNLIYLA